MVNYSQDHVGLRTSSLTLMKQLKDEIWQSHLSIQANQEQTQAASINPMSQVC